MVSNAAVLTSMKLLNLLQTAPGTTLHYPVSYKNSSTTQTTAARIQGFILKDSEAERIG